MNAIDTTVELARSLNYTVTFIDDDCFLIKGRGHVIQVTFDKYSPSWKFVGALTVSNNKPQSFGSYRAVRAYLYVAEEVAA